MKTESFCTEIIGYAGEAKNCFLEAIQILLDEKDLEKAKKKQNEGFESYKKAHAAHSQILTAFANNEPIDINILLVHSECHMTAAETVYSLCNLLISHYELEKEEI